MQLEIRRRLSAVLLILALVFGPGATTVHAASMDAKMAGAASSDTHLPGNCEDCDTAKAGMSAGSCSVTYCGGLAISPTPGETAFSRVPASKLAFYDSRHLTQHVGPPDPGPPRPTILS